MRAIARRSVPCLRAAVACAVFVGCSSTSSTSATQDAGKEAAPTDGATVDAGRACDWTRPFAPPQPVKDINGPLGEGFARLTPDERTLVFSRNRTKLYMATRTAVTDPFSVPEALSIALPELESPSITADGLTLYFHSPSGFAVSLYAARRASTGASFGTPIPLSGVPDQASGIFVTADGKTIYVTDFDTTAALRGAIDYYTVSNLVEQKELGPSNNLNAPTTTADELAIFWQWRTPNGDSTRWASRSAASEKFANVADVPELGKSIPSWISPSGCTLYFTGSCGGGANDMCFARRQ